MPSLGASSASNPAVPSPAAALGPLAERLRALDLTNAGLLCVPALCAALCRGGAIERLVIPNNPAALADPAAPRALAALLRECPALAHLNVARTGLGAEGAAELAAALPAAAALQRLDLSGNDVINDAGAAAVAAGISSSGGRCALKALRLAGCGIGNDGAEAIWKMVCVSGSLCMVDLAGNSVRQDILAKIDDAAARNVAAAKGAEAKNDAIMTTIMTSQNAGFSCAEAFAELCAALRADDGQEGEACAKALEAYYAQVAEKVPTVAGVPRDEALAIALLVGGGYFAEKLGALMDQKGIAARKGARFVPAEAKKYLMLVDAALEKIAPCGDGSEEEEEDNVLKFSEKVNTSEFKIGKEVRFGKFIIAYAESGEKKKEKEEMTLDMDRFEGKTKFTVRAPLAKEVTKFVVLGERKQGQKVFVISPNASFVVVNQAKAEIVEITSNRAKW